MTQTVTGSKIVVKDATRVFATRGGNSVHALGPVSLDIPAGKFVTIVGPSGCGKSTLLRLIGNLLLPSAGSVEIATDYADRPPTAVVFQDYSIFPWRTVEANIRMGLDVAGVGRKESRRRADNLIERLGLTGFEDAYPETLSGGMKQRVSIGRALAVEPEVLLMDEPFAALDAQLRRVLQDELLALWQEQQRTVVFVTHSLEEAILLGDRVVVMSARPGRIVEEIDIPIERPRDPDVRKTAQFAELEGRIWDILRSEVDDSLAPSN